MDPFSEYYFLGKVINPNGYKGKVNTYLDTDEPELYKSMKMVFLKIAGAPVPYFINSIRLMNNKAVIEFHDVDTIEKAEMLSKKEMYLPLSELPELTGNKFYFHEVVGFKVIDKTFGEIGPIKRVIDYPNQAVIEVIHKNKEILIPVNEDVIKQVDRISKEIKIEAPEGLIELYLE